MCEQPDTLGLWSRFPFHKHGDEAGRYSLKCIYVFLSLWFLYYKINEGGEET